jgi:ferritin-like metal-binding protein YciE
LAQVARTLGHQDIADILQETLAEEKEADQSLSELAESNVNEQASEELV